MGRSRKTRSKNKLLGKTFYLITNQIQKKINFGIQVKKCMIYWKINVRSVKIRKFPEYNYFSIFDSISGYKNRFEKPGEDNKELPPESSEFYDIAITSRCHGGCPWCYAKATAKGENYQNICETWRDWVNTKKTLPFSVAIGSIGEPTEHPDFPEFP